MTPQQPPSSSPYGLPPGLPAPVDDGAAAHLLGRRVPSVPVRSADRTLDLAEVTRAKAVVFFYPRTGVPGEKHNLGFAGESWDTIPGARGCTPQSCGFRDLHDEFKALGVKVYGFSTNTPEHHAEFVARNRVPFELLSDASLAAVKAMNLPTWEFPVESGGPTTLVKRMAWYVEGSVIHKVWYPVFPPDQNAATVLEWLRRRGHLVVRPIEDADRDFLRGELVKHFGSTTVRSRGVGFAADGLDGFVAELDGRLAGEITLAFGQGECEIVTLSSGASGAEDRGVGSALLFAAFDEARRRRCARVFLTTTNDNLRALAFYQRRGTRICAVYPGMMDRYRLTQPELPRFSPGGVPIRDEIELELPLEEQA
jgi:peroxiredoxin/GNAT superfamily N-acetyltransferase